MGKFKWIPCSGGLPTEHGDYLVTVKWVEGDTTVCVLEWNANDKEWNDGDMFGGTVVAWAKCPQPYIGG